jgi:hypothetical protein
LREIEE